MWKEGSIVAVDGSGSSVGPLVVKWTALVFRVDPVDAGPIRQLCLVTPSRTLDQREDLLSARVYLSLKC